MARQPIIPSEAFLAKLNSHLGAYQSRVEGAGTKFSRQMLAKQLGCERTTLYKWLRGQSPMPPDAIVAFCRLAGLSDEERNELLALGGYSGIVAPSPHFQKRPETEKEASITQNGDLQATITGIDGQIVTSSADTSTLSSS